MMMTFINCTRYIHRGEKKDYLTVSFIKNFEILVHIGILRKISEALKMVESKQFKNVDVELFSATDSPP